MAAEPASDIPLAEKVAFAAGDTGFNFVWQTIELYLLFYYVNVLGLTPPQAAAIFLVGGAADMIGDPLIGAVVDKTRERISARGWMLIAGPPLGFALAGTFLPSPVPGLFGVGFLAAMHVVLRIVYSLGNIPYAALTARITGDTAGQVRLTGVRMQGAAVGGLIAALVYLVLPLQRQVGGVPRGEIVLGLGYGAALFPAIMLCCGAPVWTMQATRIGRIAARRCASVIYVIAVIGAYLFGTGIVAA